MLVEFNPDYSEAQHHVFFDSREQGRFRFFPKGRRAGFTRGAANACIEWMLEGKAVLWGDTISGNIRRYVERYFVPALRSSGIPYEWNIVEKIMRVGQGWTDFRSADNPENWEGFGYDVVILNEAGIILEGENGRYLYQNAVLPMLMDNPTSELIAFGVPKGREGMFYELYQKALSQEPNYYTQTYSSYNNPWLSSEAVSVLEQAMHTVGGDTLVGQEIHGKFVSSEGDGLKVIPRAWLDAAIERWKLRTVPSGHPEAAGLDVARGGKDKTTLAPRWADYIGAIHSTPGRMTPDGNSAATWATLYVGKTTTINVDVIGIGSSAYDVLRTARGEELVHAFNGAEGTREEDRTETMTFRNLRALAYWRLREALDPSNNSTLCLPPDEEMAADLCSAGYQLTAQGIQIEAKEKIAARLGRSPDKGDAVYMALHQVQREQGFYFATF